MTEQQRETIKLIHRQHDIKMSLEDFLQSATPEIGWPDHLIVQASGMIIGITPDGYPHT